MVFPVPEAADATALLAASPVPVFVLGRDEAGPVIAFANPALRVLTGFEPGVLVGGRLAMLFSERATRDALERIEQAIAAQAATSIEILCARHGGSSYWGQIHLAPCSDGLIGQIVDVTRRVEAEAALSLSRQREALGLLTNSVAHEFNNFLQILIGYIDGLSRRLGDRPEPFIQRALTRSTEATERAAALTRQLLTYSRRIAPEIRPVDLSALLTDLDESLRRGLPPGIALDVQACEGLPPALCNPAQIESALRYLVANAVEASGMSGTVEVATFAIVPGDATTMRPSDGAVGITVRDAGHGMTPEMAARALLPFATSREAGRGVGLAIVHGLMKRQGGTITIDSRPGAGTTVRLTFPAAG